MFVHACTSPETTDHIAFEIFRTCINGVGVKREWVGILIVTILCSGSKGGDIDAHVGLDHLPDCAQIGIH